MSNQRTILLVDDDPHWLELLSGRLGKLGYRVTHAHSAEEAQRVASAEHPAWILVDRGLPGDGEFGRQLLKQFRANPSVADIPVLMTNARQRRASFSF